LKNNYLKINSFFLDCVVNSDRLGQELKVTAENFKATSNDLETIKINLALPRTELNSTKSTVADLAIELNGKINKNVYLLF
jgi:hypothetical protein